MAANPHSHFPDEETEAPRQEGTCPRCHSQWWHSLGWILLPNSETAMWQASLLFHGWRLSGVWAGAWGLPLSCGEGRGLPFVEHPGVASALAGPSYLGHFGGSRKWILPVTHEETGTQRLGWPARGHTAGVFSPRVCGGPFCILQAQP